MLHAPHGCEMHSSSLGTARLNSDKSQRERLRQESWEWFHTSARWLRFMVPAHGTIYDVFVQLPYGCHVPRVQKPGPFRIAMRIRSGGPTLLVQQFKQVGIPLSHFPVLTATGHRQMIDVLRSHDCDVRHIQRTRSPEAHGSLINSCNVHTCCPDHQQRTVQGVRVVRRMGQIGGTFKTGVVNSKRSRKENADVRNSG